MPKKVLFLCHGSICRSPAAEAIFRMKAKQRGVLPSYEVTSMALSREEIGNEIYPPMKRALTKAGIPLIEHESYQVTREILEQQDVVFYMDESNRRILDFLFGYTKGINIASLIGRSEIEDPWYSGRYDLVIQQLEKCIDAFLDDQQALK